MRCSVLASVRALGPTAAAAQHPTGPSERAEFDALERRILVPLDGGRLSLRALANALLDAVRFRPVVTIPFRDKSRRRRLPAGRCPDPGPSLELPDSCWR